MISVLLCWMLGHRWAEPGWEPAAVPGFIRRVASPRCLRCGRYAD